MPVSIVNLRTLWAIALGAGPLLRNRRPFTQSVSLRRLGRLVVLASALSGCGNGGTAPTDLEGVYQLRQLNAQPLPYDHEGLGCCTYLTGALTLEGHGYDIALTARNRNTSQVFTAREWGKVTRLGSSLRFTPDSFDVIGFLLDVATFSHDSVRVAFGGEGPGSPDQFHALFVQGP